MVISVICYAQWWLLSQLTAIRSQSNNYDRPMALYVNGHKMQQALLPGVIQNILFDQNHRPGYWKFLSSATHFINTDIFYQWESIVLSTFGGFIYVKKKEKEKRKPCKDAPGRIMLQLSFHSWGMECDFILLLPPTGLRGEWKQLYNAAYSSSHFIRQLLFKSHSIWLCGISSANLLF